MKKLLLALSLAAFALSASAVDIVIQGATLSGVGSGSTTNYAAITNTTLRGTSVVDRVMFNGLFDRPYLEAGADDELILWANDGINKGGFTASWISLGGVQKQAWPVNITNTGAAGKVATWKSATHAAWETPAGGGTLTRTALTYTGGTNVLVNCALGNRFTLLVSTNSYLIFTNVSDNADVTVAVAQGTNSLYAVAISPARVVTNSSLAITSGTNTQALIVGRPDWSGTNLFVTVQTNLQPQFAYGGLASSYSYAPDILWWTFTNGSGTTVNAEVGQNGTTDCSWVTGKSGTGYAISGNGTSQEASSSALTINTNIVTAMFWFKPDINDNTAVRELLAVYNGGSSNSFDISQNSTFRFVVSGTTGSRAETMVTSNAIPVGVWTHLCVVFDNSTSTGDVRAWTNGVENTAMILLTNTKTGTSNFTNAPMFLLSTITPSLRWAGSIDDVRLYSGDQSSIVTNVIASPY